MNEIIFYFLGAAIVGAVSTVVISLLYDKYIEKKAFEPYDHTFGENYRR